MQQPILSQFWKRLVSLSSQHIADFGKHSHSGQIL